MVAAICHRKMLRERAGCPWALDGKEMPGGAPRAGSDILTPSPTSTSFFSITPSISNKVSARQMGCHRAVDTCLLSEEASLHRYYVLSSDVAKPPPIPRPSATGHSPVPLPRPVRPRPLGAFFFAFQAAERPRDATGSLLAAQEGLAVSQTETLAPPGLALSGRLDRPALGSSGRGPCLLGHLLHCQAPLGSFSLPQVAKQHRIEGWA